MVNPWLVVETCFQLLVWMLSHCLVLDVLIQVFTVLKLIGLLL